MVISAALRSTHAYRERVQTPRVKGYLCVKHANAGDVVAHAGGRREMGGKVGDVIADCWYGWENKLHLRVGTQIHEHLHLHKVVAGSAQPEGMPG